MVVKGWHPANWRMPFFYGHVVKHVKLPTIKLMVKKVPIADDHRGLCIILFHAAGDALIHYPAIVSFI